MTTDDSIVDEFLAENADKRRELLERTRAAKAAGPDAEIVLSQHEIMLLALSAYAYDWLPYPKLAWDSKLAWIYTNTDTASRYISA